MLSTNHWQQRQMGDGRQSQGKRAFYLSFTATMEHVCYILLLLFNPTVCISTLKNYLTSSLRAIDWGPHIILTGVSLVILRGAPLTLASGRCIIQTGRAKWCLYFHQSCQGIFFFGFAIATNQILLFHFKCFFLLHETLLILKWFYLYSCLQKYYYIKFSNMALKKESKGKRWVT